MPSAICDFKASNQKPVRWADSLRRRVCPKCKGVVRHLALYHFCDYEGMSVHYICTTCGRVYNWPHSYIATGPNGECQIPITVLKLPVWLTLEYIERVEDYYARDGRDARGRFMRRPLAKEK